MHRGLEQLPMVICRARIEDMVPAPKKVEPGHGGFVGLDYISPGEDRLMWKMGLIRGTLNHHKGHLKISSCLQVLHVFLNLYRTVEHIICKDQGFGGIHVIMVLWKSEDQLGILRINQVDSIRKTPWITIATGQRQADKRDRRLRGIHA